MNKLLILTLLVVISSSQAVIEAHNVNLLDNGSTTTITAGFKITTHTEGIYVYNITAKGGAAPKDPNRVYIRTVPGLIGGATIRITATQYLADGNITSKFQTPGRLLGSTDYYLLTYNVTTSAKPHELWIASPDGKAPTGFPIAGTIADWTGGAANGVANATTGFNIISYNASAYVPEEYTTDPIWDNGDFGQSGKSGWKIHVNANPIFIAGLHVQFCEISGDPTAVYIMDSSQNVIKKMTVSTASIVDFGDCTSEIVFDTPIYLSANTNYYLGVDAEGDPYGMAFFSATDLAPPTDPQTGTYFNFVSGLQDGSDSDFAMDIWGADVIEVGGATPIPTLEPIPTPPPYEVAYQDEDEQKNNYDWLAYGILGFLGFMIIKWEMD